MAQELFNGFIGYFTELKTNWEKYGFEDTSIRAKMQRRRSEGWGVLKIAM